MGTDQRPVTDKSPTYLFILSSDHPSFEEHSWPIVYIYKQLERTHVELSC